MSTPPKPYRGIKRVHFGVTAFVSFILIGAFAPPVPTVNLPATDKSTPSSSASPSEGATPSGEKTEWQYSEQEDKMRGTKGHTARLDATDTVQLDFPYGEQRPYIGIRQSPKYGFDVYFAVDSGQIMCNAFENTYISIKFDDGPIEHFRCVDAEHGSDDVAFFKDGRRVLNKLKYSKKAVVEADFYKRGRLQVSFSTSGLEWR